MFDICMATAIHLICTIPDIYIADLIINNRTACKKAPSGCHTERKIFFWYDTDFWRGKILLV